MSRSQPFREEPTMTHSDEQYESLVHCIDGIVWEVDAKTFRFTFVSNQAEKILGYSVEQWLEPNFWVEHLHPDDHDWAVNFCIDATQKRKDHQFDYRMVAADGRVVWLRDLVTVHIQEDGSVQLRGVMFDITDHKRIEEELNTTSEQLRALSANLRSAREEEGRRIAREIHDELGSALTSLRWDLESFDKIISESADRSHLQILREKLDDMLKLTETTIGSVRRISSELRPKVLDDLGPLEAIEWQAGQFQARTGIICRCSCSIENLDLSPEQSTAIFRIFQEALTNILRHAKATRVEISMTEEDGKFVLTIRDDGRGITEFEKSESPSLGLLGMRERAYLIGGEIDVNGVETQGTIITVRIPIAGLSANTLIQAVPHTFNDETNALNRRP